MSRTRRPLAALAVVAMVALIGAGCGTGGGDTTNAASAPAGASGGNGTASAREKAVRFAECMRANGVSAFPDPDASGRLTLDGVVNGSSIDPSSAAWKQAISACKHLEPSGFAGSKATPAQMSARLEFAQCVRDHGVKDFPDPTSDGPLVDTNRIPSAATSARHEHPQRGDAEVRLVRLQGRRAGGPVTRRRWVLAGAAVVAVAVAGAGGVVVVASATEATPAAHGPPATHRDGGTGSALRHGLPVRDPDLPRTIGRLAVRRGQPGPRDVHQAARLPATWSTAATCSTGWTTARCCCCAARRRRTGRCRRATADATSAELNANLVRLGYATRARLDPSSDAFGSATASALEKLQSRLGEARTGTLGLGDAVFLPEPVRIAQVTGELGGSAQPGAQVLDATSDTLEVQVDLDPSQQGEVKAGDRARITLPGNTSVTGKVDRLGASRPDPGRAGRRTPAARPSRPTSVSTTRSRHAGSTGRRSRWRSRPRAWRTS